MSLPSKLSSAGNERTGIPTVSGQWDPGSGERNRDPQCHTTHGFSRRCGCYPRGTGFEGLSHEGEHGLFK